MEDERGGHYLILLLVLINVAAFIFEITLMEEAQIKHWALTYDAVMTQQRYEVLLTSSVLHGSPGHLIGNMVFLYALGRICESAYGAIITLLTYVGAVIVGGLAFIFLFPEQTAVGASGGVFGFVGAAMLGAPNKSLLDELPILHALSFPLFKNLFSAILLSTIFLVLPTIVNMFSLADGVAHIAHMGGLVVGLLAAFVFRQEHVADGILEFLVFSAFAVIILLKPSEQIVLYAIGGLIVFAVVSPIISHIFS